MLIKPWHPLLTVTAVARVGAAAKGLPGVDRSVGWTAVTRSRIGSSVWGDGVTSAAIQTPRIWTRHIRRAEISKQRIAWRCIERCPDIGGYRIPR